MSHIHGSARFGPAVRTAFAAASMDIAPPPLESEAAIFNAATFEDLVHLLPGHRMHPHLCALSELLDAAMSRDATPDEVRIIAHKLISQAGLLGFEQICCCSREIENTRCQAGLAKRLNSLHEAARVAAPILDRLLAEAARSLKDLSDRR